MQFYGLLILSTSKVNTTETKAEISRYNRYGRLQSAGIKSLNPLNRQSMTTAKKLVKTTPANIVAKVRSNNKTMDLIFEFFRFIVSPSFFVSSWHNLTKSIHTASFFEIDPCFSVGG